MKCKYCDNETIEEPQDFAKDLDPHDLVYGDCNIDVLIVVLSDMRFLVMESDGKRTNEE